MRGKRFHLWAQVYASGLQLGARQLEWQVEEEEGGWDSSRHLLLARITHTRITQNYVFGFARRWRRHVQCEKKKAWEGSPPAWAMLCMQRCIVRCERGLGECILRPCVVHNIQHNNTVQELVRWSELGDSWWGEEGKPVQRCRNASRLIRRGL